MSSEDIANPSVGQYCIANLNLLRDLNICYLCTNYIGIEKSGRAGEIAQWLRMCTAFSKDPNLVPRTQVNWITNACKYSSRGSDSSADTCTQMHIPT